MYLMVFSNRFLWLKSSTFSFTCPVLFVNAFTILTKEKPESMQNFITSLENNPSKSRREPTIKSQQHKYSQQTTFRYENIHKTRSTCTIQPHTWPFTIIPKGAEAGLSFLCHEQDFRKPRRFDTSLLPVHLGIKAYISDIAIIFRDS